jgi:hypothetical protein
MLFVEEEQTTQWSKGRKRQTDNNNLQNITQKTINRAK